MTEHGTSTGRKLGWLWWAAAAAVAIGIFWAVLPQRPSSPGSRSGVEERGAALEAEVTVAQAAAMRGQGTFMLDVREPEEWAESHMPGATLIPLGQLESRLSEVPRDRPVVVVCRSGNRSRRGRDILLESGYERATSLSGGMLAWTSAGLPTVPGP